MRRIAGLNVHLEPTLVATAIQCRLGKRFKLVIEAIAFGPGLSLIEGPNGAGKSVLLDILSGGRPRSVGQLEVCGQKLNGNTGSRRCLSSIGYMPQSPWLPRSWSVREYLRYAGWLKGHQRAEVDRAIALECSSLELTGELDRRLGNLSGGYQRRSQLAQALLLAPPVVVLDEPFENLDRAITERVIRRIDELLDSGTTVVVADHGQRLASRSHELFSLVDGVVDID